MMGPFIGTLDVTIHGYFMDLMVIHGKLAIKNH